MSLESLRSLTALALLALSASAQAGVAPSRAIPHAADVVHDTFRAELARTDTFDAPLPYADETGLIAPQLVISAERCRGGDARKLARKLTKQDKRRHRGHRDTGKRIKPDYQWFRGSRSRAEHCSWAAQLVAWDVQVTGRTPGDLKRAFRLNLHACAVARRGTAELDSCVKAATDLYHGNGTPRRVDASVRLFEATCADGSAKACAVFREP